MHQPLLIELLEMEHDAGSTFFTGFENKADTFADRFLHCLKGR